MNGYSSISLPLTLASCHLCRMVRSSAALALGKLSALSTRIDPLVGDLLASLQVNPTHSLIRCSYLSNLLFCRNSKVKILTFCSGFRWWGS